jgi:predicted PurR-regulated permease PerM
MPRSNPLDKTSRFITLATTILIVAVLYLARDVLIPLALAMLLTFLLAPLVNRLERYRVNRIVAVLGVVTIAFGLLAIVGYVASVQVLDLANRLPEYRGNIDAKVQAIRPHLAPIEQGGGDGKGRGRGGDQPADDG